MADLGTHIGDCSRCSRPVHEGQSHVMIVPLGRGRVFYHAGCEPSAIGRGAGPRRTRGQPRRLAERRVEGEPRRRQAITGGGAGRLTTLDGGHVEVGRAVVSLLVLLVVAGVGASVFQHTPQLRARADQRRKMSRISIAKGWKRLFGAQGFVEFAKSLGKLGFAARRARLRCRQGHRKLLLGMITNPVAFGLVIREHRRQHPGGDRLRHGADRGGRPRLVALPLEAGPAHDASRRSRTS